MANKTLREENLMCNFLFGEVIARKGGERLASEIIRIVTGTRPENIEVKIENVIKAPVRGMRGIRLDANINEYIVDNHVRKVIRTVDIEPNVYKEHFIEKRNRYYKALSDTKLLKSGIYYSELPENITIWLLEEDPYGKNAMVYTVKNVIEEYPDIDYNDGIRTYIIYVHGKVWVNGENAELDELVNYLVSTTEENAKKAGLEDVHTVVEEIRNDEERGVAYMTWEDVMRYEHEAGVEEGERKGEERGLQKGLQQGLHKKEISLICKKLKKNMLPSEISEVLELEDLPYVERICDIAKKYAPDYEVEKILEEYLEMK